MEHSRRNIVLLFISQAIALTSTITIVTYSALVGKILTGSTSMATIPAAAGLVAAALTAYPASMLMKKYGRKKGFHLGGFFALLAGFLSFYGIYAEHFIIFTFGVMIHGIFQAFAAFYRFTAMEITAPHMHKQAVSYVLAGGLLAAFVAPSAAQFFEVNFYLPIPYAGTYILVMVLSFLTQFIIVFVKFPENIPATQTEIIEQGPQSSIWNILKRPAFLCASLNAAGAYLIMSYVMTSSPMQIVEYCGFPLSAAASVIQWHVASMFLPAFFCGSLIARYGSVKILLTGMVCLAASATFAIQGLELINFYGSLVLLGLGWNFMFTAGTTLLQHAHNSSEKARVQGMNDFVVYGLTAISTLSSGYMLEHIGWMNMNKLVFGVLGLLFMITLWYVITERKTLGAIKAG
ncbi:MAG: MFS transporter [Emcibacter sp.]|nr:MFS transporter [Emcibacter sp.]